MEKIKAKRNVVDDYCLIKNLSVKEKVKYLSYIINNYSNLGKFIDEKDVALAIVKQDERALEYVDWKVKGYKEIALEAIKINYNAVRYVDFDHVDLSIEENSKIIAEAQAKVCKDNDSSYSNDEHRSVL